MNDLRIITAESVTEGHPDKLCDLIADMVLDECLKKDKKARVACEVMATDGKIIVAGEITAKALPDIAHIVYRTVHSVGYPSDYEVEIHIHDQSRDIRDAVNGTASQECCSGKGSFTPGGHSADYTVRPLGAGDQGIMYGYATMETEEYLPLPCVLANRLTQCLSIARKLGVIRGLLPDGKAQVSVGYDGDIPIRLTSVVVSCQHAEGKGTAVLRDEIRRHVINPALSEFPPDAWTEILINPSGRFVQGGFGADTGLTGRKLMADTYGGIIPHGGGALSGKDGTKVDRSGAYMARYSAKNIVAAGLAEKCTVCVAYAIGRERPLSLSVDSHGTGVYGDGILTEAANTVFDFRPVEIIRDLELDTPIFANSCCYGHFMKQYLPWERIDKTDELWYACNQGNILTHNKFDKKM